MTGNRGSGSADPFSNRAVLALVLFGVGVFVAMLWMVGAGMASGSANDGGSHAAGKGLNGYAAFAEYLDRRGHDVRVSRNERVFEDPGLLVLTPPQAIDGEKLERIVSKRQHVGPTLIVTPKWLADRAAGRAVRAKKGWVYLTDTQPPSWEGFLDDVSVTIGPVGTTRAGGWNGDGLGGRLPIPKKIMSGEGHRLVPLVKSRPDGRILAAYLDNGGDYPALESLALAPSENSGKDFDLSPLVVIFEPDLLDNYGFADSANARLAEVLTEAMQEAGNRSVNFDLTLNGLGRSANLLTLAFTPPFLAATLCLLMAALAIGWRAFLRFGPSARNARSIAFGKRALVINAAGLLRRARRLHLIAEPYVERTRDRLTRSLALPRHAGHDATDAAIDRAMEARSPGSPPFTELAGRLRSARVRQDIVKAAQDLHALERTSHPMINPQALTVAELGQLADAIRSEVGKAIVGQAQTVDHLLVALMARGHALLEGPPGTAKTFLAQCFAASLGLDYGRIQFTPDLMPGDIVGSNLFNFQTSQFTLTRGPIFCDLLLADEINRTPPKTQAALLEAMQERRVTLDGEAHLLGEHFMVVATQNPIESQGVYPLPEAQLDRFLFKLLINYPDIEEERRIVARYGENRGLPAPAELGIRAVATAEALDSAMMTVKAVTLAENVIDYVVRLVRATRESPDLASGASPRAAVLLAGAARARAALQGRDYVLPDDVKALATSVLRHRLLLSPAAEIEGKQVEALVERLIEQTEAPR